jgi:aldehyde dehydrogenase family 7 protein A1
MLRRTLSRMSHDLSFLAPLGIVPGATPVAACFDGKKWGASGEVYTPVSPVTGKPLHPDLKVQLASVEDANRCIANIQEQKAQWMVTPAPKRGEIVRQIAEALRANVDPLGRLLGLEVGKITAEGKGEVQEFVDIADFATGLSRQLPGQVLPSERPGHFMMEQWHPLGAIGIIAAFNFPIAVPGWNISLSLICGNTHVWKASPSTSLCGIATQRIISSVMEKHGFGSVAAFMSGGAEVGQTMVDSKQLPLISFTGSTNVGRTVNQRVAARFGKALLELGGNNAIVVMDDADVEMAIRSVVFGAVGTAGQRCTTCRRLLLHKNIYDSFVARLVKVYQSLRIGDPTQDGVLVGPLHCENSVKIFEHAIAKATAEGAKVLVGGKSFRDDPSMPGPWYVQPTILEATPAMQCVQHEAFVPILHVMKFETLDEAITINNSVSQGLSSALFTLNMRHAHKWTSALGSDCGIVNVNLPTNGAEIGGAFGGEKETGGGRESGSDSWRQYMRRVTSTVNYTDALPLAQGITFNFE